MSKFYRTAIIYYMFCKINHIMGTEQEYVNEKVSSDKIQ